MRIADKPVRSAAARLKDYEDIILKLARVNRPHTAKLAKRVMAAAGEIRARRMPRRFGFVVDQSFVAEFSDAIFIRPRSRVRR